MEKYFTINEISQITRFAKQTIYNKIYQNNLRRGIHYIKPSRRKILFKQEAIDFLLSDPINESESDKGRNPKQIENENTDHFKNHPVTQKAASPQKQSAFNI